MTTGIWEGKLWIQTYYSVKNGPCVTSCLCGGFGSIYIYIYIYTYIGTKHIRTVVIQLIPNIDVYVYFLCVCEREREREEEFVHRIIDISLSSVHC